MAEKPRYRYYEETNQLYDNEKGELYAYNLNKNKIISILNQQDKRIKELEQENLSLQEQSIRDNQNWIEETTQLKQQIHDLPKKIVGEVEKNFTEYLPLKYKTGAGFYARLNLILKKYGGEDE